MAFSSQPKKYEVFISFRGADIRNGFLSHLHTALIGEGINTFLDENLERGEDISSSILEKIEQSYICLVIFSESYAFSPWCLDELVKILDCRRKMGQMLLPVFYRVDPTNVQDLTGSFGDAIVKLREELKDSLCKVDSWCQALKETARIAGLASHDIESESKLIEKIIIFILKKLDIVSPSDSSDDHLVGIDTRVRCAEYLLSLKQVLGIWGMGGIGKTTIAKKLFDRIYHQYTTRCFVASVREKAEKRPLDCLQSEIISMVLAGKYNINSDSNLILSSARKRTKVLIVLDDVSDLQQIELVLGENYGSESRIIITSRDKQLLKNADANIYEVEGLNSWESLQLFCLHAFKNKSPKAGFWRLSITAVRYAQGNPLAVKVLGSNLYRKSIEEWKDELKKLEYTSNEKVKKILKISYDGLCENDKATFLDIACFFKMESRDDVERILGTGSKIGISLLVDRALLSITNQNKLQMHDLLQQMGKDIICEEKQLGKRSRLWQPKDILYVLLNHKGTEGIQGISLDMSTIRDMQLSAKAFDGMCSLGFLKFYEGSDNHLYRKTKVHLPEGLKFLSGELRFLQWDGYPLKSLPNSFCAENLVELRMVWSKLKELWGGVQHLENLKLIDLRWSKELVRIPDLSRAINLEALLLSYCSSLVDLSSSLKYLSKLTKLELSLCRSLCSLPRCLHSEGLKRLYLMGCSEIKELPKIPCYERHSRIKQVPSSFQLSELHLSGCSRLENLPDNICNLKYLSYLNIHDCVNLYGLPKNFGNLFCLRRLDARGSGIEVLPESICNLKNLRELDIGGCVNLCGLPKNLGNLECLEKLTAGGAGIKELPDSICNLKFLKELDISGCVNLHGLPENLGDLKYLKRLTARVIGIKELPNSICNLKNLKGLDISNCVNLNGLPENLGNLESLRMLDMKRTGIKELPESICNLKDLRRLNISGCVNIHRLPKNFKNLSSLKVLTARGSGIKELSHSICNLKYLMY